MGRPMKIERIACVAVVAGCLLAAAGQRAAFSAEAWTPLAGEVGADDLPRQTQDARFKHACALVATGQYDNGIALLRSLIEERPGAEFAERARYMIGLALFSSGRYSRAFTELEGFLKLYPGTDLTKEARELQLRAALEIGKKNLHKGLALLDRLMELAPSDEFAARCQKQKADLALLAERYMLAKDAYQALVDQYPGSDWVPYCFRKMAECDLKLGLWLARGEEYFRRARKMLRDFVKRYRDYAPIEEVRRELARAEALEAEVNKRIAIFYIECEKRPTAAVNYLSYIRREFPHTDQAAWAAQALEDVLNSRKTPLVGRLKPVPLPGLTEAKPQQQREKD